MTITMAEAQLGVLELALLTVVCGLSGTSELTGGGRGAAVTPTARDRQDSQDPSASAANVSHRTSTASGQGATGDANEPRVCSVFLVSSCRQSSHSCSVCRADNSSAYDDRAFILAHAKRVGFAIHKPCLQL